MAILPVYTTSKLHAARINLKHLAQQTTLGVSFNYVKGVVFGRKWAWFSKIFEGAQARPTLPTPLHEILDPPLPFDSDRKPHSGMEVFDGERSSYGHQIPQSQCYSTCMTSFYGT